MEKGIKDSIIIEAQSCFYLQGFKKTSVDKIVSQLNISKKTLYKHFTSKDELIKAVIVRIMESLITEIDSAIESRASISDALKSLYDFSQKLSANISRPMLDDMNFMPGYWQIVEKERRKALGKLSIILENAQNDGLVKKDLDIDLFVKILITTFDTFARPNRLLKMDLSPSEFADRVFHIFIDGIMVDSGGRQNESTKI